MCSDVVIRARNLSKAYHIYSKPGDRLKQMLWRGRKIFYSEFWALRDINLDVQRGETIGVVGRNGSGKSTFLQIISGTLAPSGGELSVNGRIAALLELGAGFNPEFTGRENVYLAASILGLKREQIDQRYESIAEFAGIGDFINQPVKIYSSGMYARLAFAVAAHVDADILVIDEILAVGDAAFTQKCMRFIRRFKEHGTIFFVSHDTSSVVSLCDRAIWLEDGRLRQSGEPKEVCYQYLAAMQSESASSDSFKIGTGQRNSPSLKAAVRDQRQELLSNSNLKNEIELFEFNPNAPWFGKQHASITSVQLLNSHAASVLTLEGGEIVELVITAQAKEHVSAPIFGFYLRDKLGQNLFGDNTFLTYIDTPLTLEPGQSSVARFKFQMPFLPSGDFSIAVALAEGTQAEHVQHHWIDEALIFKVHSSHVAQGLVGIPMLEIKIEPVEMVKQFDLNQEGVG